MTKVYGASLAEERAKRAVESPDVPAEIEGEQILRKSVIPYATWMEFEEERETGAMRMKVMEDFFFKIIDGEAEALDRLRTKLRASYSAEDLMALIREVVEDALSRPTQPPSSSDELPGSNGTPSTATSSSTPGAGSKG